MDAEQITLWSTTLASLVAALVAALKGKKNKRAKYELIVKDIEIQRLLTKVWQLELELSRLKG